MAHITHANVPLTPRGGLALARCVVDNGWPLRRAVQRFQVSVTTAHRWTKCYRSLGKDGMHDQPSRSSTTRDASGYGESAAWSHSVS